MYCNAMYCNGMWSNVLYCNIMKFIVKLIIKINLFLKYIYLNCLRWTNNILLCFNSLTRVGRQHIKGIHFNPIMGAHVLLNHQPCSFCRRKFTYKVTHKHNWFIRRGSASSSHRWQYCWLYGCIRLCLYLGANAMHMPLKT